MLVLKCRERVLLKFNAKGLQFVGASASKVNACGLRLLFVVVVVAQKIVVKKA
jgi:hypothetical protein